MSLIAAPMSRINYDDFDINPIQATLLELIRKSEKPEGEVLVKMLLANRYTWFSVFPSIFSGYLALNDISQNHFSSEGLILFTDAEGVRKLNPLFDEMGACNISYLAVKDAERDNLPDAPTATHSENLKSLPNETRCYMYVGWPENEDAKERFEKSFN